MLSILYLRKIQEHFPDELSYKSITKNTNQKNFFSNFQSEYTKPTCDFENTNKFIDNTLISEDSLEDYSLIENP